MTEINNTGERILLEKETPLMIARHFCAYNFAKDFVADKSVLDLGCGEGYGSYFLAGTAKEVLAIDYDPEVINYAKGKYHKDNLKFMVLDVANLSSIGSRFDVICSFQNIEHIRDTDKLLKEISGCLNAGGTFICSTCNIKDASPGSSIPFNKFHVKEYTEPEFRALLEAHFGNVEVFGLRRGVALKFFRRLKKIGINRILPEKCDPVKIFYKNAHSGYFKWGKASCDKSLDFIAVCRSL